MTEKLEQRLREFRSRVAIRAWEYRQRDHAKGVWYRVRRVLCDTEHLFVISADLAKALIAGGLVAEPCFLELEPPKTFLFVPAERLTITADVRKIPVNMGEEWLAARFLAGVPFEVAKRQFP